MPVFLVPALTMAALLVLALLLWRALKMSPSEKMEYDWYIEEHHTKVGGSVSFGHRMVAWNGAKGGRAPKWHWIAPVEPLPGRIRALRALGK